MVFSNKLLCLFIYILFNYRKAYLASCTDTAGAQAPAAPSWTPGNNHVEVDLSAKQSTNQIDYESKAGAHVFTTKDGFFIGKVVATTTDSAGNTAKRDVTTPNNHDARRVILYTIAGKGPQLEVIYAADLATNNTKFDTAITNNVPYGPDVSATTPATPPAAPTATPAEHTAPDASAQPMAEAAPASQPAEEAAQPMAEATPAAPVNPTEAAPVAEPTESSSADGSQVWTASAPPQDQSLASAPEAHAAPTRRVDPQQASAGLAGALGGSAGVDASGRTYQDFEIEDSDEENAQADPNAQSTGAPKFIVKEVYGAAQSTEQESDDDDYTVENSRVSMNDYVKILGQRVSELENRVTPVEDKVDLLIRMVNYQHELLEVNKIFKSRGLFDASFIHGMAPAAFMGPGAPLFRPATHDGSRELDHSQFPSDLKLYIADPNDANALVELGHNDLTVKTEDSEVMYNFKNQAKCNLVKFEGRTAWNHRDGDLHPNWVAFYPLDEKVVLDFQDALVMFVKKPDPNVHHMHHEDITLSHHADPSAEVAPSGADAADAHAEVAAEADAGLTAPAADASVVA